MLRWSFVFLAIAIVAGFLTFGVLEGLAMCLIQGLFLMFLVLFLVSLVFGLAPRGN